MAGLDPAIHPERPHARMSFRPAGWMAGSGPAMTSGSEIYSFAFAAAATASAVMPKWA